VLFDAAVWAVWSAIAGLAATRVPDGWLERDSWLTAGRAVEGGGRSYERLGIRRWKDAVPEAGRWFGGLSKRHLAGTGVDDLRRFAAETRRAEYVHWVILAVAPVMVLWNPPTLAAVMLAYGAAANLPCIAIQRYNRARIARIEARVRVAG
jgi:glycosyl-4,4'-diaponeurosporenoate acyltransferase